MSIHALPTELLEEIMDLVCTDHANLSLGVDFVPEAVILSCVCRHWRSITLSLSSIWSSIYIVIPRKSHSTPEAALQQFLRRIHVFIERSSDHTLDLSLNFSAFKSPLLQAAMTLLISTCHRWGKLVLRIAKEHILGEWKAITHKLFALHTLTIEGANTPIRLAIDVMGKVPALRCLQINLDEGDIRLATYHQSLPNLEVLRLTSSGYPFRIYVSRQEIYDILDTFADLRKLSVSLLYDSPDAPNIRASASGVRHNIQSLSLDAHATNIIIDLPFTFPRLSDIALGFIYEHWTSSRYIALIQRSSCTITSFTLGESWAPGEEIIEILKHIPSLTTLSLRENLVMPSSTLNDAFFDQLRADNNKSILPSLQRLVVLARASVLSIPAFLSTVSSRCFPNTPEGVESLRKVDIRSIDVLPESEVLESLKALSLGIQVKLRGEV